MEKNNFTASGTFTNTYKAEFILLGITAAWGLSFPLIKISLNSISSGLFLFLRFAITLKIFMFVFRNRIDFLNIRLWRNGIILGVLLFLGFAFQTVGLEYTTASKSGFITGTNIIIIPFAQYLILKIKPAGENIVGTVLVLTGLYILSEAYITIPNTGDILTLFCSVFFAFHIILLNKYSNMENFLYITFGQFFTMTVLSLFFTIIFDPFFNVKGIYIHFSSELISTLLYTSVFSTFLSILFVTKYQPMTTPLRAGIIYSMESIFAAIFAYIFLTEILNFSQITGALIMLCGFTISEFYRFIKIKFKYADKSIDKN